MNADETIYVSRTTMVVPSMPSHWPITTLLLGQVKRLTPMYFHHSRYLAQAPLPVHHLKNVIIIVVIKKYIIPQHLQRHIRLRVIIHVRWPGNRLFSCSIKTVPEVTITITTYNAYKKINMIRQGLHDNHVRLYLIYLYPWQELKINIFIIIILKTKILGIKVTCHKCTQWHLQSYIVLTSSHLLDRLQRSPQHVLLRIIRSCRNNNSNNKKLLNESRCSLPHSLPVNRQMVLVYKVWQGGVGRCVLGPF